MTPKESSSEDWPVLDYRAWQPTCSTLHLWTQIVGKARLAQTPWLNHSWHATFYLTARGLTTSTIPCGSRSFEVEFDFLDDMLLVAASDGRRAHFALAPQSVAEFHGKFLATLAELELDVRMHDRPNELADSLPFEQDRVAREYDPEAVRRFWRALLQAERVFLTFRSGFLGKVSPVHLFWGALDLAVTRFSGRRAPRHPGGVPHLPDGVAIEAYSHEVSSAGFWPGGGGTDEASFYSYAYPEPDGYRSAPVLPEGAFYDTTLREYILPYAIVRKSAHPDRVLLDFLQTTYEAAADRGDWNRSELECPLGVPGVPRPL